MALADARVARTALAAPTGTVLARGARVVVFDVVAAAGPDDVPRAKVLTHTSPTPTSHANKQGEKKGHTAPAVWCCWSTCEHLTAVGNVWGCGVGHRSGAWEAQAGTGG